MRRSPLLLLEAGTLVSGAGNGIALVVLPWLVLELTGSATAAGAVATASLLPLLLSSFFAGTVVDMVGRKRVAIVSDVMSGVSVAAIPVLGLLDQLTAGWLIALAMLGAALDPAGFTAREAILPGAAEAARWPLDRANGVHEAIWGVAFLLGPGLGGMLIGWVGAQAALWFTAAGFALSVAMTALIQVPGAGRPAEHERPTNVWHATLEGVTFVWQQPLLRATTLFICLVLAAYLPFESVILPYYFNQLDSPAQLGWVITAMAAGGVVGSLAYPRLVRTVPRYWLFVVSVLGACLMLVGVAALPAFWLMLVLAVLTGLFWGPVQPILNLAMQVLTPERLRGRTIGVITSVSYAAGPLGLLLAGPAIDLFGVSVTALAFSGSVLALALTMFLLPSLKQLSTLARPAAAVAETPSPTPEVTGS